MNKIISFQSPVEHYTADGCIVWCFDDRFSDLLSAFSKDFKNFDLVKVAGGAKALASGASPECDLVLTQIRTSLRLHGTKRIVLMLHRDCGAYGGSKGFADSDAETENLVNQLVIAKQFVADEIPGVPIETYLAEFDGLYVVN